MSDSRFHLKIDFEIYGKKFDWNASLNYYDRGDGMDERIFNWFVCAYEEAYASYQEEIYSVEERSRKKIEDAERAELARLKDKYENGK